jgi:hypothetical protein
LTSRGPSQNVRGNIELKLRKIGNSVGVILPSEVLESLQVKVGGKIALVANERGYQLSAEESEFEEQMRHARSLMARYRGTLRELAK